MLERLGCSKASGKFKGKLQVQRQVASSKASGKWAFPLQTALTTQHLSACRGIQTLTKSGSTKLACWRRAKPSRLMLQRLYLHLYSEQVEAGKTTDSTNYRTATLPSIHLMPASPCAFIARRLFPPSLRSNEVLLRACKLQNHQLAPRPSHGLEVFSEGPDNMQAWQVFIAHHCQ